MSEWSPAAYLANVCGYAYSPGDSMHTPRQSACKPAVDFELQKAGTAGLDASPAQLQAARSHCAICHCPEQPPEQMGKVYTAHIRTRKGAGEHVVL